jgi:hypothetical protein
VVFGVRFYGPRNITTDPLVRAAFQRALYVSAGVAYINSRVASPDDEQLCGVNVTNTGGFRRRLDFGEAPGVAMDAWEDDTAEIADAEADARRMQVFGVSDFTVMLHHVEEMFRVEEDSRVEPYARATRAPTTPDTNVYFSVISNVVGTNTSCMVALITVQYDRSDEIPAFIFCFFRAILSGACAGRSPGCEDYHHCVEADQLGKVCRGSCVRSGKLSLYSLRSSMEFQALSCLLTCIHL